MGSKYIQYFVEGEDDQKVVNTLKTQMGLVKTGKVHVLNVIEELIPDMRLRTLSPGTTVVLVFDTDTGNVETLNKNIKKLKRCPSVKEVITIPQVSDLEDELVCSCNIRKIEELLNSKSRHEFKSDVLRVTNLESKLREHRFNIDLFWNATPPHPYRNIENQSKKVKLKSK